MLGLMGEGSWQEELKRRRYELRHNLTPPELRMWEMLKGRKFHGYRWRRQVNIGNCIVDYYCPKAKVVVELEGMIHIKRSARDATRVRFLESLGILVLRFKNTSLLDDREGVERTILEALKERCPDPYRNRSRP